MGDPGGHLGWALVLLVLVPALFLLARRRWRSAAARAEEVRRLAYLAAAEAERAEMEAYREYSESIMRESGWVPPPQQHPVVYDDDELSSAAPQPQPVVYQTVSPSRPATEKKAVCAVCYRETTTRCAKCKAVRYCSGKCQIIHWRQGHKDECREPQIRTDNNNKPNNGEASAQTPISNPQTARVDDRQSTADISLKSEAPTPSKPSEERVTTKEETPLVEPDALPSAINADFKADSTPTETSHGNNNKSGNKATTETPSRVPEENIAANNEEKTYSNVNKSGSTKSLRSSKSLVKEVTGNKTVTQRRVSSILTDSARKVGEALRSAKSLDNNNGNNGTGTAAKNNLVKQHTVSKTTRNYPSDLMLFPYDLFLTLYNSDRADMRPFGLINCGNSCYANTVFQCLMFTRPLTAYLVEGLHTKNCGLKAEWCFTCEFEKLVLKGKQGKLSLSPANILSGLSNSGSPFGLGREEDAHEFMKYVIEKMQSVCIKEANISAKNRLAEETTLVQLIFGGYLRSKIRCMKCQHTSEQCERMMDLTVPIEGNINTLEDALAKFTSYEVLDGENKYQCDRCKSYQRAKKKMTILEAPNVLTISLKRYQSGKFGKINKPVRFREYLSLADYMSGYEDNLAIYSLYAVVVHRDVNNAAFSGHYVCYVKDAHSNWYEVNDNVVQPVSLDAVLSKCAYMLFYARLSPRAPSSVRKAMAIDPVRRKPKPSSDPSNQGTRSSSSGRPNSLPNNHHLFTDGGGGGRYFPAEYSSDSSSLFSNSDEASSSSVSTAESMASTSTNNDDLFINGDYLFGVDSDLRPSSGLSAGPNLGSLAVAEVEEEERFLYTDSRSGVFVAGYNNNNISSSSSSWRETDWGVMSRRPPRERSEEQTFYS